MSKIRKKLAASFVIAVMAAGSAVLSSADVQAASTKNNDSSSSASNNKNKNSRLHHGSRLAGNGGPCPQGEHTIGAQTLKPGKILYFAFAQAIHCGFQRFA